MMDFKKIEISDKNWIDSALVAANLRACNYNFTNLFAWADIYTYRMAQVEKFLVVKGQDLDGTRFYLYPAGQGDTTSVLKAMIQDAAAGGDKFVLAGISTEHIVLIDRLFPEQFVYTERRDTFDYIYLLDKLVTLAGSKLHSKRNHINYFKQYYQWSIEPISSHNLDECWEMNREWCKIHRCIYDVQLESEKCAVRKCFEHYSELGLEGGALRSNGKIIAYTIGDKLNSDTYDIHVEKAFDDIRGAYQMINREFAVHVRENHPEVVYINREEDMDIEGLRKAKLSYYPAKLEEKYWGKFQDVAAEKKT